MKTRLAVLTGLLVTVLPIRSAEAAPAWQRWRTTVRFCDALNFCSQSLVSTYLRPTGTTLSVRITNPGNSTLVPNHFNWTHPNYDTSIHTASSDVTLSGTPGVVPTAHGILWDLYVQDDWFTYNGVYQRVGVFIMNLGVVQGCESSPLDFSQLDPNRGIVRLCPRQGYAGAITSTFETDAILPLPEIMEYQASCAAGNCDYSVSPEPQTWALMATGLAAVGLVGWRRRRRN